MKSQEKIHICYIITRGDWGGAQRYVFDIIKQLNDTHQISIIIGGNGNDNLSQQILHEDNIQLIHIPTLERNIHFLKDFVALISLRKTLKQLAPDIIHLNSTKASILGSIASTCVPFTKVVYTVHGWVFNEPQTTFKRRMYTYAEKYTQKFKDSFIVLSEKEMNDGIEQLSINKNRLTVIPNGISKSCTSTSSDLIDMIDTMTRQKDIGNTVFLTIANLYRTKGLDILIQAIVKLPATSAAHFFIVGDGPLQESIQFQIKSNKLEDKITLLGAVTNASTLLPYADYSVMPSRKEGLSYVLLESLRAGTPIIATEVGANREVFETCKGIGITLIPSEDVPALSTALSTALTTIKEEAIMLPPLYTQERMISSTTQLYHSLLADQ